MRVRSFAWMLSAATLSMIACGSEVKIVAGDDDAPEIPADPSPPEPVDVPQPDPVTCGEAHGGLTVTVEGSGCAYGVGVLDGATIEPLPAVDGVVVLATECTVTVTGIGSDIADQIELNGESLQYRLEPRWIELYPLQICPFCVGCPCPHPMPIVFAGDGDTAPLDDLPRPVRLERGAQTCSAPDAGCPWEAYELDFSAYQMDSTIGYAESLLGAVSLAEADESAIAGTNLRARVLRANGPGPTCTAQGAGEAAWAVYRPVQPTL
jgi:hypothetical protein